MKQLGFEAKHSRGEAKRQLHKEIEIMKGVLRFNTETAGNGTATVCRWAVRHPLL